MKRIDIQDQAIAVLTHLKTQELVKAVEENAKAIQDLAKSLQKYADWLEEELVRMEGEK